jgi:ribosome maturation factor RimP
MTKSLAEQGDKALAAMGCYVVDVEVEPSRSRPLVRYFIGCLDDSTVTVDICARASRTLEALLDESGRFGTEYAIEVSSPGIDRRLARPNDFARFAGRRVKIRLKNPLEGNPGNPLEGKRNLEGILVSADQRKLVMSVGDEQLELSYELLARANLVFDSASSEE